MQSTLKNKRASIIGGSAICVMIILVAFTMIQVVYMLNTHYTVTRAFEHSLTMLETTLQRETYDSLSDFQSGSYQGDLEAKLEEQGTTLKNKYLYFLEKNPNFKTDEENNQLVGNGFTISFDDINIKSVTKDATDHSFKVDFTVTAKISYTTKLALADKPTKISTGKIDFTSSYEFVQNVGEDSNNVSGNTGGYADQGN